MPQHADVPSLEPVNKLTSTVSGKGFSVRDPDTISAVPCPCGQSTRIVTARDGLGMSFHITEIRDATLHFHRNTTEIYHILDGTGTMELNGSVVEIRPGLVITIEPGTRHRVKADEVIRTVVIALPAFDPADEFFE